MFKSQLSFKKGTMYFIIDQDFGFILILGTKLRVPLKYPDSLFKDLARITCSRSNHL